MAKTSKIQTNLRKMRTVERFAAKRAALKAIIDDQSKSEDEQWEARLRLQALPRDANPNRVRMRCGMTGRPRGNYRKFGICRVTFRELALLGEIPGVRKASW